ncbi:MAG TPA: hypothetical protein PLQ87_01070 [Phycisphaerae bacterium]|nr:hypothetical protein [Phycisphaerae bacterium]
MKYKHADLVRAWLDGHVVEYKTAGKWIPLPPPSQVGKMPHFYTTQFYRLRPFTARTRLAQVGDRAVLVQSLQEETTVAADPKFRQWLTEWVEVTAPGAC